MTNVDSPFESPVILSFCTGGRMLERGVERAIGHVTTAAYVEIEAFCIYNLVAAMEKGLLAPTPIWTDLKTFPSRDFHGKIHGIIGGYPCQPFSTAGKQEGEEDPRHLWPHIAKHISAVKPVWCFFENVANHLNIGFETVHRELSAMGYHVEAGIYSAEEVGAPHQRKRMFILAMDKSKNIRHECGKALGRRDAGESFEIRERWPKIWSESKRSDTSMAHTNSSTSSDFNSETKWRLRQENVQQGDGKECSVRAGATGPNMQTISMAYPESERCREERRGVQRSEERFSRAGVGQADTRGEGLERQGDGSGGSGSEQPMSASGSDTGGTGSEGESSLRMRPHIHVNGSGVPDSIMPELRNVSQCDGDFHIQRWPARPGEDQHEWEAPRVVKSGLGCTIDGYNFREDLLRMYGNGVVEQTAEIAFIDLLNKIITYQ